MKTRNIALLAAATALLLALFATPAAADDHERIFELRTYITEEGMLETLQTRFRDHTVRLFEKHGMDVIGFWVPNDEEKQSNHLVYLLAFPSVEARTKSWKAFGTDPEWQKVAKESRKNGKIIKEILSEIMTPTDYSALK